MYFAVKKAFIDKQQALLQAQVNNDKIETGSEKCMSINESNTPDNNGKPACEATEISIRLQF